MMGMASEAFAQRLLAPPLLPPPFFGSSGATTENGLGDQAVSARLAPNPSQVIPVPASPPTISPSLKSVQTPVPRMVNPAAYPSLSRLAQTNRSLLPTGGDDGISGHGTGTSHDVTSVTLSSGDVTPSNIDHSSDADNAGNDDFPNVVELSDRVDDSTADDEGGDGSGPSVHGPPQTLPSGGVDSENGEGGGNGSDAGNAPAVTAPVSAETDGPETVPTKPAEHSLPGGAGALSDGRDGGPSVTEVVVQRPEDYTMEQLLPLLREEMERSLQERGHYEIYQRWRSYIGERLVATAPRNSNFEMRGNCRVPWVEQMLRAPIAAPVEAERFSRELHEEFQNGNAGLVRVVLGARAAMGLQGEVPEPFVAPASTDEAMTVVEEKVLAARAGLSKAISTLTQSEAEELDKNLLMAFCGTSKIGHTVDPRYARLARRLCDLMEKMDRSGLYDSALALACLTDETLLDSLSRIPETDPKTISGVTGTIVREIQTDAGRIIVGGRGNNIYNLDELTDVCAVIDLGGNDQYLEGTVNFRRPVLVIIDLEGDDYYRGQNAGVQGGAVFGCSLLVDRRGNDVYQASDVAQGSALCGVGILVDMDGNDYYGGVRRVQGHALGGIGILLDKNGNDQYRAALSAQGFGGPLGFGILDDLHGDDAYHCGGYYLDGYPETPGYDGWGQGIGAGLRQIAAGGIGILLDGDGDDVYEYDYMGHGGGYWAGLGIARDFAGNDTRYGGTRKMFDGSPRSERMFQRFGCGFGCHYAIGFCFDDGGDDVYGNTIMGIGMGWDLGIGYLCDIGCGNDVYNGTGSQNEGYGMQAGMGVLFDYGGDDVYAGRSQGTAPASVSPDYHRLPECGGNFGFVVDYGGNDRYGSGASNNAVTQRGSKGGFVIDRPLAEEYERMKAEYEVLEAARMAGTSGRTGGVARPAGGAVSNPGATDGRGATLPRNFPGRPGSR